MAGRNHKEQAVTELPRWFLENCVKTASELKHSMHVAIRKSNSADNPAAGFKQLPDLYQLESCTYETLLDLFLPSRDRESVGEDPSWDFSHDAVLLRLPGKNPHCSTGAEFLRATIAQFASDVGADLVVLDVEDLHDLTEHFLIQKDFCKGQNPIKVYFDQGDEKEYEEEDSDDEEYDDCDKEECDNLHSDRPCLASRALRALLDKQDREKNLGLKHKISEGDEPSEGHNEPGGNNEGSEGIDFEEVLRGDEALRPTEISISHDEKSIHGNDAEAEKFDTSVLYRAILGSGTAKRMEEMKQGDPTLALQSSTVTRTQQVGSLRPVVVLLPDIFTFSAEGRGTRILNCLKKVAEEARTMHHQIIMIGTIHHDPYPSDGLKQDWSDSFILSMFGSRPYNKRLYIFPLRSQVQESLFQQEIQRTAQKTNIRRLQRAVIQHSRIINPALAHPYAQWTFPPGSIVEQALREGPFPAARVESMARLIARDLTMENINTVIERDCIYAEALKRWLEGEDNEENGWKSKLPRRAWPVVKRIMEDQDRFELESKLLGTIVDPNEIHASWSDIELDPEIKLHITQIVSLLDLDSHNSHILKKGRIGGALLYGPPGTGKTHLARVLSKSSSTIMLQISAAELESKWVGESEKTIKALFKLGKMLFPCIIFIDEADALFFTRDLSSRSWENSRINQLLGEVDGVVGDMVTPFLLLATNHPGKLDQAVLRRVPSRFYLGLPSTQARENIFKICLKGDDVCPNLNYRALADITSGYTGSDIGFVCKEATVIWADEVKGGQMKQQSALVRLGMSHFLNALKRSSPTVSKAAIQKLEAFARSFDKPAWERMKRGETVATPSWGSQTLPLSTPLTPSPSKATGDLVSTEDRPATNLVRKLSQGSNMTCPLSSAGESSKPTTRSTALQQLQQQPPPPPSVYHPLDKVRSEIRLLEILDDGSVGAKIHCKLHTASLAKKPTFTALSYVWGDVTKREEILVNGEAMSVTESLASSLRWVKHHWQKSFPERDVGEFRLWADALCINQHESAVQERNHQVQLMRDIYSGAELTMSVVATNDSIISHALDIYNQIFDALFNGNPKIKLAEIADGTWLLRIPSLRLDTETSNDPYAYIHGKSWGALSSFGRQPYWSRVWIIQEAVLSKQLLLICGDKSFEFKNLQKISSLLSAIISKSDMNKPAFLSHEAWCRDCYRVFVEQNECKLITSLKESKKRNLPGWLPLFRQFTSKLKATDPRDHIYAFLGLADINLEVDYQNTVEKVYLDFVKASLAAPQLLLLPCGHSHDVGNCSFLQFSGVGNGNLDTSSPSWLPDFSCNSTKWDAQGRFSDVVPALWELSGPEHQPEIDDKTLKVSGAQVLQIVRAEKPATQSKAAARKLKDTHPGSLRTSIKVRWEFLDFIRDIILENEPNVANMSPLEAVFRAIQLNEDPLNANLITDALLFFRAWQDIGSDRLNPRDLCRVLDPDFEIRFDPKSEEAYIKWFLQNFFPGQEHVADHEALRQFWDENLTLDPYMQLLDRFGSNALFQSGDGYIGLGSEQVKQGDVVCMVKNCNSFVVLRKADNHYQNVGACFVVGLTREKAEKLLEEGEIKLERFEIL